MSEELSSEGLIGLDLTATVSDPKAKKWMKRLEKPIKAVTKIAVLEAYINRVDQDKSAGSNWNKWLKHLQIFTSRTMQSAEIPNIGATVFVSNHPFGMIDGIALAAIIKHARDDVKMMANHSLQPISGMGEDIIGVDPYEHNTSKKNNLGPIRETLKWLKAGNSLIVFPGGDVSNYNPETQTIIDPPWNPIIGRIILNSKASVVPIFFHGTNSSIFYKVRKKNERLGSFMLARECLKKRGQTLKYSVGKKIPPEQLHNLNNAQAVIDYVRTETYKLASIDNA